MRDAIALELAEGTITPIAFPDDSLSIAPVPD